MKILDRRIFEITYGVIRVGFSGEISKRISGGNSENISRAMFG